MSRLATGLLEHIRVIAGHGTDLLGRHIPVQYLVMAQPDRAHRSATHGPDDPIPTTDEITCTETPYPHWTKVLGPVQSGSGLC